MSEQSTNENEQSVDTFDKAVENIQAAKGPEEKSDYVEFNDEQQAKFNDVYKQMKSSGEDNKILKEEIKVGTNAMIEMSERLKGLEDGQQKQEMASVEQSDRSTIDTLQGQLKDARIEEDEEKVLQIEEALLDKKLEIRERKPTEVQKPVEAAPKAIFGTAEENYIQGKAVEMNEKGELVRPWLMNNHPDFENTVKKAAEITDSLMKTGKDFSIAEVVSQLDEQMAKETPVSPSVMESDADLTTEDQDGTIKLTDAQRYHAKKLGLNVEDMSKRSAILASSSRMSISEYRKSKRK